MSFVLCACTKQGNNDIPNPSPDNQDEPRFTKNLLADADFSQGFKLLEPRNDGKRVFCPNIDYNGKADESPIWEMSQWASPYNFKDATYTSIKEGVHKYENESRSCIIDTNNSEIEINLNSWTEYQELFGHSRTGSENWSHFLLEQSFPNPSKISELKSIYAKCEFRINKAEDLDPGQPIPCAQLTWYFTITDVRNGDPAYQSKDNTNDFMWFGIPIFDSRYEYLPENKMVDKGFNGATNKLIYGMDSRAVFKKQKVEVGKDYIINIDILPYIKDAYLYGITNEALVDSSFKDLTINYMNIGWELPGSFDASLTLKNMSVMVEEKL
jgi:hypothetical protein